MMIAIEAMVIRDSEPARNGASYIGMFGATEHFSRFSNPTKNRSNRSRRPARPFSGGRIRAQTETFLIFNPAIVTEL
jgi:hypothetical protein